MTTATLRVGTRASVLAMTQTRMAIDAMSTSSATFEIVEVSTKGDLAKDVPFASIGPKGVFAAELQRALLDGAIDLAVHSLKDLPVPEPEGLAIGAVLEREDPRDVVVSRHGTTLDELPDGSIVGTSSSRRAALIGWRHPRLVTRPMRGNVDTRLRKVQDGEYDAAVLAAAGVIRLGRSEAVTEWLDAGTYVPPPGQGAIAIEARADRLGTDLSWLTGVDHAATRASIEIERAFTERMEGGCEAPLGVYAPPDQDTVTGFVATPDGSRWMLKVHTGTGDIGRYLADQMLADGAAELMRP